MRRLVSALLYRTLMGRLKGKSDEKLKGKHILVVEDYPLMGALLMDILKRYDHASYASSGNEAIKEIKQKPPDIVLLDLSLPDMSGLEVARKLRNNQRTKSIPILAMSGSQIEKKECLEAGCNDFILKPFDTSQLLAQLAALVPP
jgi:two-component system, OmpR family, phosphate regulon response regulator PhoB